MGFGSNSHSQVTGFRANSNRSGTTPAHDWRNYPEALAITVSRLSGVVIENKDATEVMAAHDSQDTLHYVDPPYIHATRGTPSKGYAHEMTDAQHEQLLGFLGGLRGMVVLSGYAHPIYDDALSGWQRISCAAWANGARPRMEVLWLNASAQQRKQFNQAALFG